MTASSVCAESEYRVITATVCQIVYWNQSSDSSDPMFDQWRVIICTQVALSASIVTACVPQIVRLLDCLQSGMLGADDLRRRGQTGSYGYTGHSGKNRLNAYYMLEPRDKTSNGKADQQSHGTSLKDQMMGNGAREFDSQEGRDEESQHSTSRIVKRSDHTFIHEQS